MIIKINLLRVGIILYLISGLFVTGSMVGYILGYYKIIFADEITLHGLFLASIYVLPTSYFLLITLIFHFKILDKNLKRILVDETSISLPNLRSIFLLFPSTYNKILLNDIESVMIGKRVVYGFEHLRLTFQLKKGRSIEIDDSDLEKRENIKVLIDNLQSKNIAVKYT